MSEPQTAAAGARGNVAAGLPEIVIAPAHPVTAGGEHEVAFEVRQSASGGTVLPVFSSVRRLVEALGPAQPWLAMPLSRVRELAAAGGVHEVALDPLAEPGAWRWQYTDLVTVAGSAG